MGLESELARRAAEGSKPTTMAEIHRRLEDLGYRIDRSGTCRFNCKILSGPGAGDTYPAFTVYIREIDTGMCAFHVDARRDENFKALQKMRFEERPFAIVRGHLLNL